MKPNREGTVWVGRECRIVTLNDVGGYEPGDKEPCGECMDDGCMAFVCKIDLSPLERKK